MVIYSDFYINPELKIEILPTDKINDEQNLFAPGDRYVSVYRPVENDLVANLLHRFFLADFIARVESERIPIVSALAASIQASNISFLTPPASSESIPISGAMALVLYISPDSKLTFAQLGQINIKKKKNGHFTTISNEKLKEYFFGSLAEGNCYEKICNNAQQFISTFQ